MSIILKNKILEVEIGEPGECYSGSRFDLSGNVVQVKFDNKHNFLTSEKEKYHPLYGFGLLNEFDIDSPPGFNKALPNGNFHKIGVGLLRKTGEDYHFFQKYPTRALVFNWKNIGDSKVLFETESEAVDGFQYEYSKAISISDNCINISYKFINTGSNPITTSEYCHNFLAINNQKLGADYRLKINSLMNSDQFSETVNISPLKIDRHTVSFNSSITNEFFIARLNGEETLNEWILENPKEGVALKEHVDFTCSKMNLWGSKHVISPELFNEMQIMPGEKTIWNRFYTFYNL